MEKITQEQFKIETNRNRMRYVAEMCDSLEIGEGFFISYKEYADMKITSPFCGYFHQYLRQSKNKNRYTVAHNKARAGWFILRVDNPQ